MKKTVFKVSLIIIDIAFFLVASLIVVNIYKFKRKQTLGAITHLNRDRFNFPEGKLKYYYEPKPGEENYSVSVKPTWLPRYPLGKINKDGLRERFDYNQEKDSKTYRIVALGDSWTFGLYVDVNDSYPERLEDKLNEQLHCEKINKFEVLNLGVPGHDVEYNVERYRRKGEKYSPDLILWLFTNTMLIRVNELYHLDVSKRLPSIGPTLTIEQLNEIDTLAFQYIENHYGESELLTHSLNAMSKLGKIETPIALFVFPSLKQEYKDVVYDFAKVKVGSHVVESIPDIPTDPKLHFAPFDTHPNLLGYKQLSDAIYVYIKSSLIPECTR